MRVSTKAAYGLRLLVDLALHHGAGPMPLKEVAERQELPLPYLEHLIAPLVAAGVVRTKRGARGGVYLARDPSEIRLDEVIRVLEGSISPLECVDDPGVCHRSSSCAARELWRELKAAMERVLESTTLRDLAERQRSSLQKAMYYI